MARAILLAATALWSIAAVGAVGIAIIGIERLLAVLPPLAIDADAVRGAVVALGIGAIAGAGAHGALVVGLGGDDRVRRIAATVAMLLGGLLAAMFVGLGAAAMASAVARPEIGGLLWTGAAAALVAAAAYAGVVIALVAERRSRRAGRLG